MYYGPPWVLTSHDKLETLPYTRVSYIPNVLGMPAMVYSLDGLRDIIRIGDKSICLDADTALHSLIRRPLKL